MLILPISRRWISSRIAERTYLCCAILALALSGTWLGTLAAQELAPNQRPPVEVAAILRIALLVESFGAAVLWAGMLYFWFGFDRSSWVKRAFWVVFLLQITPLFWALYYFLVYRKQQGSKSSGQNLDTKIA